MKIAVFGTGIVGRTLGTKFVSLGHEVVMGSRDAANPTAVEWAEANGARAGTFADAAAAGDLVVNATAGVASLQVLHSAGEENLAGKVLLDVSNPLDFSQGFPPLLALSNTDSVAESLQRAFARTRVVKSLNTMSCQVMVDPGGLGGGDHDVFVAGDDADAKAAVTGLLQEFGWAPAHILDLGALSSARGMEMYVPLWLRIMGAVGGPGFNIRIVRNSG